VGNVTRIQGVSMEMSMKWEEANIYKEQPTDVTDIVQQFNL
jgi:hypothetical protein